MLGGWHTPAEKLRGLGEEPQGDAKSSLIPVAQLREKGVVSGSFLEAAKPKPIKSGDSVWFEVGASVMQRRLEQLN